MEDYRRELCWAWEELLKEKLLDNSVEQGVLSLSQLNWVYSCLSFEISPTVVFCVVWHLVAFPFQSIRTIPWCWIASGFEFEGMDIASLFLLLVLFIYFFFVLLSVSYVIQKLGILGFSF